MDFKMLATIALGTMLGAIAFNNLSNLAKGRVPALTRVLDGTVLT